MDREEINWIVFDNGFARGFLTPELAADALVGATVADYLRERIAPKTRSEEPPEVPRRAELVEAAVGTLAAAAALGLSLFITLAIAR